MSQPLAAESAAKVDARLLRLSAQWGLQDCFESGITVTTRSSPHAAPSDTAAAIKIAAATGFPCTSSADSKMRCFKLSLAYAVITEESHLTRNLQPTSLNGPDRLNCQLQLTANSAIASVACVVSSASSEHKPAAGRHYLSS